MSSQRVYNLKKTRCTHSWEATGGGGSKLDGFENLHKGPSINYATGHFSSDPLPHRNRYQNFPPSGIMSGMSLYSAYPNSVLTFL